jgi:hypothetical protein
MKFCYNIEMSHIKEVVINHKVFYNKSKDNNYVIDVKRTPESTITKNVMPKQMSANDMAEYVRDYIGVKRWKIVLSSGTINIFKKPKKVKKEC